MGPYVEAAEGFTRIVSVTKLARGSSAASFIGFGGGWDDPDVLQAAHHSLRKPPPRRHSAFRVY